MSNEALKLAEIKGYVTALYNDYSRSIEKDCIPIVLTRNVANQLNDILDIIEDKPTQETSKTDYRRELYG